MKKIRKIYLSPPYISKLEKKYVERALNSGWIAPLGPEVEKFEEEVAKKIGVKYALALSSGTAALHLAMILIGVKSNDYVICPTLTFAASSNVILYQGGTPFFVDVNKDTWTIAPDLLEEAIKKLVKKNKRPKAVITVDLYGVCCDYDKILEITKKYEIPIVEDAAEALGSKYKDRMAGSFGWLSALSFNGNKIITTSGGGMLLSNDKKLIEKARFLATQARDPYPFYQHSEVGYNYRMSNILAALGRAQLRKLDKRVSKRRWIRKYYEEKLKNIEGISFIPDPPYGKSNCWLTCIQIDKEKNSTKPEELIKWLAKNNIEARHLWKPMHMQPLYRNSPFLGNGVSEKLFECGLCLPSGSSLNKSDLKRIVKIISCFLK